MDVREAGAMPGGWRRTLAPAIIAIGCLLRLHGLDRPLDHRSLSLWHEADYTQIARNFVRETADIRYPRIDWRGDSTGNVEMELPILPWAAGLARRAFRADERSMRLISAAFACAALLLFAGLARRALPPPAADFALACFALSPLAVYLATRMQPESALTFFEILAAALIWRWYEAPGTGRLLAAAGALAAAILIKEPAAFLGLTFGWLIWRRLGPAALRDPRIYLAAAVALAPAVAWYGWAYRFWAIDGNSLGLSDEAHLVGLDVLLSRGLLGNARTEIGEVLTPLGLLLAAAGLRWAWRRIEPAVAWYASALIFYVLVGRTAGAAWAFYYHCLSVAPACLLMGAGAQALLERAAVAAFGERAAVTAPGERAPVAAPSERAEPPRAWRWVSAARTADLLRAAVLASLGAVTVYLLAERDGAVAAVHSGVEEAGRREDCARQFAAAIPPGGRIVVRGLDGSDAAGHRIAFNDPTFFAFADRKGFVVDNRQASLATLQALRARGARWWIVAEDDLARPAFGRAAVDRTFARVAACDGGYALYDLDGGSARH
jgi:hypothetical protein